MERSPLEKKIRDVCSDNSEGKVNFKRGCYSLCQIRFGDQNMKTGSNVTRSLHYMYICFYDYRLILKCELYNLVSGRRGLRCKLSFIF